MSFCEALVEENLESDFCFEGSGDDMKMESHVKNYVYHVLVSNLMGRGEEPE